MAAGDRWSDDPEDRHEWHLDRIRVSLRYLCVMLTFTLVLAAVAMLK